MKHFLPGLALIITTNTHALYWQNNYGVDLEVGTDDNYFLTSSNETDTNFSKLSLFVGADGSTETSSVLFLARVNGNNYSDKSIDDSLTSAVSLAMSNRGERLDPGLDISYTNASTFESQLLDTGVRVDGRTKTWRVAPDLSYRLTERNTLLMGLSFKDVSYNTTSLIDYQDNAAFLSWGYGLNETSNISANVAYSRYEPDTVNVVSTDTASISLGYELRPTEATTYNFRFGYSDVDGPAGTQSSRVYSVDINHQRDELNSFTLNASQIYEPDSLGSVRIVNRLDLGWAHAFTEKLQGLLSVDYVHDDFRDYYEVKPGLRYHMTEHLSLAGDYRFRREERTAGNAESDALFITLSYNN